MLIHGIVRAVELETFKKKDGTTGRNLNIMLEVRQPMSIMQIQLSDAHSMQEQRYRGLEGKAVLLPADHVGRTWEGRTTYRWTTTGDGAPVEVNSQKQAA